jgi:hypothetical protein
MATSKFKRHRSPGNGHILVKVIHAGGEILRSEFHYNLQFLVGIRENCLISGRSLLLYQLQKGQYN